MASRVLYASHLKWKTSAMEYTSGSINKDPMDYQILNYDQSETSIRHRDEIKVLGVPLDRRGGTGTSMEHRFTQAEAVYGSIATLPKNPNVPVKEKLDTWARGPLGSSLYGWGSFVI